MSEPKHIQKHRLLVSAHEHSARKTKNTELQELKMTLWSIEPRYVRLATTALRTRHERDERDALKLYVDELKAKISQIEKDWIFRMHASADRIFNLKNKIYASVSATLCYKRTPQLTNEFDVDIEF